MTANWTTDIAAACQDGVVRLWDCKGFALIHEFQGHEGWVVDVDISPSGQVIASVGEDCRFTELDYFWLVQYRLTAIAEQG